MLLLFGIIIAAMLVKVSKQDMYLSTLNINSAFHAFLMAVSKAVYTVKVVNYYQFSNNPFFANFFLAGLSSYNNITSLMDRLVVNFDIGSIT